LQLVARQGPKNAFQIVDYKTKQPLWKYQTSPINEFNWFGKILCMERCEKEALSGFQGLLLWNGATRQLLPSPPTVSRLEVLGYSVNAPQNTLAYVQERVGNPELVVWDYRAKRVLWQTRLPKERGFPEWSPDGKWLVGVEDDYEESEDLPLLVVYDQNGKLRYETPRTSGISRWSPDSKQLAINVVEVDKLGKALNAGLEIHRFGDE